MVNYASNFIVGLDKGEAATLLSGVHVGCFVLFGHEGVHGIADLKGKTVGVPGFGTGPDLLLSLMAAEVGLNPKKDLRWADPAEKSKDLFIEGKIDAYLGFPPEPQELRAKQIGRVIFDTAVDRPWSQYFCCMLAGNREFVRRHPVATKRAMRAILKAADLCASEPARAARLLVDGGFTSRYDYALQTLKDVPYDKWREYDPEDTIRFYTLRMRDAGFIKSTPQVPPLIRRSRLIAGEVRKTSLSDFLGKIGFLRGPGRKARTETVDGRRQPAAANQHRHRGSRNRKGTTRSTIDLPQH